MNINPSRYLELSIPKRKSEARQAFDVLLEVTCAFVSGKSHPLYNERMGRPFNQPICEKDVQDTQAALDAALGSLREELSAAKSAAFLLPKRHCSSCGMPSLTKLVEVPRPSFAVVYDFFKLHRSALNEPNVHQLLQRERFWFNTFISSLSFNHLFPP